MNRRDRETVQARAIRFAFVFRGGPVELEQMVRHTHRWLSIASTVAVIVNLVAVVWGKYTARVGLLAVVPLVLQLFTGLYLFALPYVIKWRIRRRTA